MPFPNPAEVITVTLGDKTFRAGRRTAAHLQWTIERLAKVHPGAHLHVMQPCYNTGVALSAGTHDKDGCLDVSIAGLSWPETQKFLRRCGWAAWWRHTGSWSSPSIWHVHMASLGCPGPVGVFVPGQIDDYHRHAFGLAGQHTSGSDPSWFPPDIDATVFDYRAYWEAHLPTVSLSRVRQAACTPAWRMILHPSALGDRRRVLRALKAEGCATYRAWQIKFGLKGEDADGVPRRGSLNALGIKHDFRVTA